MESRNIALVPFTVDHLCGIGSMAHQLLFHEQQAPFPAPNITRAYAKHLEFTLNRCTQAHLMTETDALPHIEGGHNIPFNCNPMVSAARDSTVVVV